MSFESHQVQFFSIRKRGSNQNANYGHGNSGGYNNNYNGNGYGAHENINNRIGPSHNQNTVTTSHYSDFEATDNLYANESKSNNVNGYSYDDNDLYDAQ